MVKKIILTLLVAGMCLSSFAAFAENTDDPTEYVETEQQTEDGNDVNLEEETETEPIQNEEENEAVDETADETADQDTPNEVKQPKKEKAEQPEKEKADNGKSKVIKDALKERKQARAEAKIEAKDFIKDLRNFFKDADTKTRKEILGEIAALKKELKDLSIGAFVRGLAVDFEKYDGVKPVIENNRTLVPVRAITETLGATVEWIEDTKTIVITKDENVITMQLDEKTATVNGVDVELEVAPTTKNGRTIVPIRFIAESLQLTVEWDEDSQTIVVE